MNVSPPSTHTSPIHGIKHHNLLATHHDLTTTLHTKALMNRTHYNCQIWKRFEIYLFILVWLPCHSTQLCTYKMTEPIQEKTFSNNISHMACCSRTWSLAPMHGIICIAWHIQHFGSHNHEFKKTWWAVFYSLFKHQSCQACHLVVQKVRQMLYIQFILRVGIDLFCYWERYFLR